MSGSYVSNKLFLAASKRTPKGWCYDHIGFIDSNTGDFVQMSGHRYEEGVFSMARLTEDAALGTNAYDVINLPKTVTFSDDTLGAQNCVTFVVAVLNANGIDKWNRDCFHRIFKCGNYKAASLLNYKGHMYVKVGNRIMSPETVPKTTKQVSRYLAQQGYPGYALWYVRGSSYFFFHSEDGYPEKNLKLGDPSEWPLNSVYVPRVSDLTLGRWLEKFIELAEFTELPADHKPHDFA